MKNIFTVIIAALITLNLWGEDDNHLTFKGIPINEKSEVMGKLLEEQGFCFNTNNENNPYPNFSSLKGRFAGYDNCTIVLLTTPISKIVWKVLVYLPQKDDWASLKVEYSSLKDVYTKKYGNPKSFESFTPPFKEGDGKELVALKDYKASYMTFYNLENGNISIDIDITQSVCISYEDSVNSRLMSTERKEEVYNDI